MINTRIGMRVKLPITAFVKQSGKLQLAWLGVLAIGILAGKFMSQGPYLHGVGIGGQMLTWDGLWYADIAQHGYSWDPAVGRKLGHYQNVAFFPGYPMIEWTIIKLTGNASSWLMILPGLLGQSLAILAFLRFASTILKPYDAVFATWLFALWPASCFMAMGYPTGFINLCAILTLSNYHAEKPFKAALICGIGTALAPTMVFIACALCVDFALRNARILRHPLSTISFALGTVSGLLCFMFYLAMRFHDPFVFTQAQDAFNITPPPIIHIETTLDVRWYSLVVRDFIREVWLAIHHHEATSVAGRERIEAGFQRITNLVAVIVSIGCLVTAALKLPLGILAGAGACVLAGYLWFIASTDHNMIDGTRLLYPAIGVFLGAARLPIRHRSVRIIIIVVLAVLSALETALVAAGYAVI